MELTMTTKLFQIKNGAHHDYEDVPDKELRPARRLAGRREDRVSSLVRLERLLARLGPRVDVAMQLPLLQLTRRSRLDCF